MLEVDKLDIVDRLRQKIILRWVREKAITLSTVSTESTLYTQVSANAALVLINVACGLLRRQLNTLAADFENEGGFTERLYKIRKNIRKER